MSGWTVVAGAFFVLSALALAALVHGYFVWRMVLQTGGSPVAGWVLVVGFAALVIQPALERTLRPGRVLRAFSWVSYLWLGASFYLLLVLGGSELVIAALGVEPTTTQYRWCAILALSVTGVCLALGVRGVMQPPRVRRREVRVQGWPSAMDGYQIVQVSDVHIGPILGAAFARKLVSQVNALQADLVAITGDLVDGSAAKVAPEVAPLADLSAADGVWFVTGNHDMYSGCGPWLQVIDGLGIQVLRNRHVCLGPTDAPVVLAGVNDHHGRFFGSAHREDLDAALGGAPVGRPVVLLAHDPGTFRGAARRGVALQLSGHTHGGQMWPFGFFVRLATPFVGGWYQRGSSRLHVSNGTGFWGPPLRLGAPAEVVLFTLRPPR